MSVIYTLYSLQPTYLIQASQNDLLKFVPGAKEWYYHIPLTDTQPDLLRLGSPIQPLGTHSNQKPLSIKPLNPHQRRTNQPA